MKKYLPLIIIGLGIVSCTKNPSTKTDESSTETTNPAYAYPTKENMDWQPGKKENIEIAMNSLKAMEEMNIEESIKYFGDSILLEFDYFEEKVTRERAGQLLKTNQDSLRSITITMEDYESVQSKDGKTEYVSLWYKQKWEDNSGKIDSLECMDDVRIKDNKIIGINGKSRHYQVKKQI